jgi:hypothetical protein
MKRRAPLGTWPLVAPAALPALAPRHARAQGFPARPLRMEASPPMVE